MSWIWSRTWSRPGSRSTTGGLVGDQGADVGRVGGDQGEPDDGAAAAAEDAGWAAVERGQQAVDVVGLLFGRDVLGGVLAGAVADAARVVGDHRVAAG